MQHVYIHSQPNDQLQPTFCLISATDTNEIRLFVPTASDTQHAQREPYWPTGRIDGRLQ